MLSLPLEIFYSVSDYIGVRDYHRLRQSCKFLLRLNTVKYLDFQRYKENVSIYGMKLRENRRISLYNQSINDESFIFLAVNGHSAEFLRLLKTNACDKISVKAKQLAFTDILEYDFPQDMIERAFYNPKSEHSTIFSLHYGGNHLFLKPSGKGKFLSLHYGAAKSIIPVIDTHSGMIPPIRQKIFIDLCLGR
jgi:hypothetical protein